MDIFLFLLGMGSAALVGYSYARIQHHKFMARAWDHMSHAPMGFDEKLGVTQAASDVMKAFGKDLFG